MFMQQRNMRSNVRGVGFQAGGGLPARHQGRGAHTADRQAGRKVEGNIVHSWRGIREERVSPPKGG